MRDDRGAAAVETALVFGLLLAISGLVAPLPVGLLEKSKLERAAAQSARWATSAPPSGRGVPRGTSPELVQSGVQAEVQRVLEDSGSRLTGVTATLQEERQVSHCPLRVRRTVEVSATLDLGPLSTLYAALPGTSSGPRILTARATACDE